jgi:murein DD-endopeptidase MepM/ murein hydrolase activator NlpD
MGGPGINQNEENKENDLNFQLGILKSNNQININTNQNNNLNSTKTDLALLKDNSLENQPSQNKLLSLNQNNLNLENKISNKINFILPTEGLNWGILHPKNAVDIAASCGNNVLAASDGLVIDLGKNGWNSGYGKYIKIEHLNNVKTLYAHLSSLNVSLGDYVKQGQKIGEVGQTGEATGCHLHFEVLGEKNPFIK